MTASRPSHRHAWSRGQMTNGDPWWFCACGDATDRDPATCRVCGGPLSEARVALALTLCSGPCHRAARKAASADRGAVMSDDRPCAACGCEGFRTTWLADYDAWFCDGCCEREAQR